MTPLRWPCVRPEEWAIVVIAATAIAALLLSLQAALG